MDLISGLKSELFRPLVTLVVPGAIAIAPYVIVVQHYIPDVGAFWTHHSSAFVGIVIVAIVAAGMVLEDIGAQLETFWDKRNRKRDADEENRWNRYLALNTQDQIIGQRYLRTLSMRMKFELSATPALLLHSAGLYWVHYVCPGTFSRCGISSLCLGLAAVGAYMAYESYCSTRVLARVRKVIVDAIESTPATTRAH